MPAALFAVLLAAAAPAMPAGRPTLIVAVRQDTHERFDAAALRLIDREVARVWRPYADVMVRDAADVGAAVADDVLTLVFTDRRSASGDGLGWIQFIDGEPTRTIYVSRTEAVHLAGAQPSAGGALTNWPPNMRATFLLRVMARAAAHEVGHYLLRSTVHTATGLMRARFTIDDVMDGSSSAFRLEPAQQAVLQQRLRGYLMARAGREAAATQ